MMPEIKEIKGPMPTGYLLRGKNIVPKVMPVNAAGEIDSTMSSWAKTHAYAARLYQSFCARGSIQLGKATVIKSGGQDWVLLPIRSHSSAPASQSQIEEAIVSLVSLAAEKQWHTIAIPPLGDDVSWNATRQTLEKFIFFSSVIRTIDMYGAPKIRLEVIENGDILTSNAFGVVIPVAPSGLANKGLARRCANMYPAWDEAYQQFCREGRLGKAGYLFTWTRLSSPPENRMPRKIIATATVDLGKPPKLPILERCLSFLQNYAAHTPTMTEIAIPAVHSGFAGVSWPKVKSVIEDGLEAWPETVDRILLYPPYP
jgi:O-acetyl-ADP-ribose deacetylase (regulator of RNase III)